MSCPFPSPFPGRTAPLVWLAAKESGAGACPGPRKWRSPRAQATAVFLVCVDGGSGPGALSPGAYAVQPRGEMGEGFPGNASAPGLYLIPTFRDPWLSLHCSVSSGLESRLQPSQVSLAQGQAWGHLPQPGHSPIAFSEPSNESGQAPCPQDQRKL